MYMDRLDGRITATFFDEKSAQWRQEQKQIEARMRNWRRRSCGRPRRPLQTMRAVSEPCAQFDHSEAQQQRALASATAGEGDLEGRGVRGGAETPWQILAHSNSVSQRKEREKPGSGQEIEIWLLR